MKTGSAERVWMSQEVFQLIQGMDLDNIKTQLALQCAPVLSGIKIANLLILSRQDEALLRELITGTDLIYFKVLQTKGKTTYLLFWRNALETYLSRQEVVSIFQARGYRDMHLGYVLLKFAQRYMLWNRGACEFPHEMGLLLGYPADDVEGFMQHRGKNFLYSGYWKVYQRVEEKQRLFSSYESVTAEIMQMIRQGTSVKEVVSHYRERTSA